MSKMDSAEWLIVLVVVLCVVLWRVFIGGSGGIAQLSTATAGPVASIPEFSGGSSVHEWIQRARKVAEANGWSDLKLLSVLPAFLAGKALIEYNSIMEKKKQFSSLDALEAELQQALSQYEDPLDEFFETRLRWGQSVVEFVQTLQHLLNSSVIAHDKGTVRTLLKRQFINGLPDGWRSAINDQVQDLSLDEMVKLVKRWERSPRSRSQKVMQQRLGSRPQQHQGFPKPRLRTEGDTSGMPFRGRCFTCGEMGHRAAECPSQKSGNEMGLFQSAMKQSRSN